MFSSFLFRKSLFFILAFLILLKDGNARNNFVDSCAVHISQHERHLGIPKGLLHAISKVESGRKNNRGNLVAWPWTVNANGQGYYFPTKEAAIAAVRNLQSKGVRSIDVGCMQVNLYHHPEAFKSLEDAFEPAQNVAYAASFLNRLKNEHVSWRKAVSHYHSANPVFHIPYHRNVMNAWKRDTKTGGILLAVGMSSASTSYPHFSKMSRLRRLSTVRKASVQTDQEKSNMSKAVVRRVTRAASKHLRRISSGVSQ